LGIYGLESYVCAVENLKIRACVCPVGNLEHSGSKLDAAPIPHDEFVGTYYLIYYPWRMQLKKKQEGNLFYYFIYKSLFISRNKS